MTEVEKKFALIDRIKKAKEDWDEKLVAALLAKYERKDF